MNYLLELILKGDTVSIGRFMLRLFRTKDDELKIGLFANEGDIPASKHDGNILGMIQCLKMMDFLQYGNCLATEMAIESLEKEGQG